MTEQETKSDKRWSSGEGIQGIVTIGDPSLRQIADAYKREISLIELCDDLVKRLRECNGAGLAASQIGRREPVIVAEVRKTDLFPDRPESPLYVMINPRILDQSKETDMGWEGCFSVPGLMAMVPRSTWLVVEWLEKDGELKREQFEGYLARVLQHELDHLIGKLFTDRMDPSTLTTVDNWRKFHSGS